MNPIPWLSRALVACLLFLTWPLIDVAGTLPQPESAPRPLEAPTVEQTLRASGHARVLIQFAMPGSLPGIAGEDLLRHQSALRERQHAILGRHFGSPEQARVDREFRRGLRLFDISPLMAMTVTEAEYRALLEDPEVTTITLDTLDRPHLMDTVPLIGMTGSEGGAYAMGATGAGQAVAILDTGVQGSHPFLEGKVIAEACFSNGPALEGQISLCPNKEDTQIGPGAADVLIPNCYQGFLNICDHGTHVAGIAAGEKPTLWDPRNGVAIKSTLVAVQVFTLIDGALGAYVSDQIRALEWVFGTMATLPGGNRLAAVNMSLGGGLYSNYCDLDPRKPIIEALRLAGVATTIASGNDGSNNAISAPACISPAVAVGATSKVDVVTPYSNQSESLVDLLAPGGLIEDGPGAVASSVPDSTYAFKSGTSMAAPHVAGAFAALRSARPAATVDEIETALEKSGILLPSRGGLFFTPRIQVNAALKELTRTGRSQTITFGPAPGLTFGGTAIVSATATSGLTVEFSSATPATCRVSINVVTGTGAGACTIIANQPGNVTWLPAPAVTQSLSVARAAQTITFDVPAGLVYDQMLPLAATASSGLAVAYQSNTPAICVISGGSNVKASGVGTCSLTATQAGNANYEPATPVTRTFRVEKAPQSIAFSPPPGMVYDASATLTATASSGLTVVFSTNTPVVCQVSGNQVKAVGVGQCTLTASQAGNENYLAASVTQGFSISKAPQTLSFAPPAGMVYGETRPLVATASSGLVVSFASTTPGICEVLAPAQVRAVGVGECRLTLTQAGDQNYQPETLNEAFPIERAPQSILFTAVPAGMIYGATAPLAATASSGLAASFVSDTPTVCSVGPSSVTAVGVGNCIVTASQTGNVNYLPASPVSQSFNIDRAPQTISFGSIPDIRVGQTILLTASASSGLPIAYATETPDICAVGTSTVTGLAFGACLVIARQEGNENFLRAVPVERSFNVEPAAQSISFDLPGNLGLMESSPLVATASSGLPVNFRSNSPAVCRVQGNLVTTVGFGICSITAGQVGDNQYAPAPSVTRLVSVIQPEYPGPLVSLSVSLAGNGQGTVISQPDGILCGAWCQWNFTKGTRVRLEALPKDGARFVGWSGACKGSHPTCVVRLRKNRSVRARFR